MLSENIFRESNFTPEERDKAVQLLEKYKSAASILPANEVLYICNFVTLRNHDEIVGDDETDVRARLTVAIRNYLAPHAFVLEHDDSDRLRELLVQYGQPMHWLVGLISSDFGVVAAERALSTFANLFDLPDDDSEDCVVIDGPFMTGWLSIYSYLIGDISGLTNSQIVQKIRLAFVERMLDDLNAL